MVPVWKEVVAEQLFVDGLARSRDRLALEMILHGRFPSQGWRIVECFWKDGEIVRYSCFPLAPHVPAR